MLTNNLKILDTTKTEFFQLRISQSDEKIRENYCRGCLSSTCEPLTY